MIELQCSVVQPVLFHDFTGGFNAVTFVSVDSSLAQFDVLEGLDIRRACWGDGYFVDQTALRVLVKTV